VERATDTVRRVSSACASYLLLTYFIWYAWYEISVLFSLFGSKSKDTRQKERLTEIKCQEESQHHFSFDTPSTVPQKEAQVEVCHHLPKRFGRYTSAVRSTQIGEK
jgi:hypothetical protein